jgi:CHAD domain-containing protein
MMPELVKNKSETRLREVTNCFPLDCARLIVGHIDLILALPPKVLEDQDIEMVHEMRRGVNRLRTGLKHFPSPFGRKKSKLLRKENRWLARELGKMRDLDVALLLLAKLASSKNKKMKAGYDWAREALMERRAPLFASFADTLRSKRFAKYRELLRETKEVCETTVERRAGEKSHPTKDEKVTEQLPPIFKHLIKRLLKKRTLAGDSFSSENLHKLRLAGKRVRYFTDFFRVYRPSLCSTTNKQLKKLHDTSGLLHDIDVIRPILEESFAQLTLAKPAQARGVWPGASHLFRKMSSRRLVLQERIFRYWRMLHTEPFTRRSQALAKPWIHRKRRK